MDRDCGVGCCGRTASPEAQRGLPEEGRLSQDHRKGQPGEQAEECSRQRGGRCAAFMSWPGPGALEEGGACGLWPVAGVWRQGVHGVREVRGAGPAPQGTGLDVAV